MTAVNSSWLCRLTGAVQQLHCEYRVLRNSATSSAVTLEGDAKLLRFVQLMPKLRVGTLGSKAYYIALLSEARLKQEISILKDLSHSNLEKLIPIPSPLTALDGVMSITSYYDQDLEARCNARYPCGRAPSAELLQAISILSSAVAYLHGKRICHRKICPKQIRMKSAQSSNEHWYQNIVLCGFKDAARMNSNAMVGRIGSLRYIAPEMLQGPSYSEKVDVWSLACSIASFFQTRQERNVRDASFRVLISGIGSEGSLRQGAASLLASEDHTFTSLQALIRRGLRHDPSERCNAQELRERALVALRPPSVAWAHPPSLVAPIEWRKEMCRTFSTMSQVPLCRNDVVGVTGNLSLSRRETILAWFRTYRKVCTALAIDATGPAAAAAFSMSGCNFPDAAERPNHPAEEGLGKKRRRKQT